MIIYVEGNVYSVRCECIPKLTHNNWFEKFPYIGENKKKTTNIIIICMARIADVGKIDFTANKWNRGDDDNHTDDDGKQNMQ